MNICKNIFLLLVVFYTLSSVENKLYAQNDSFTYINERYIARKNGKIGLGFKLDTIKTFLYDFAIYDMNKMPDYIYVFQNDLEGLVDFENNVLLPIIYESIRSLRPNNDSNNFLVKKAGKYGSVNDKNEVIFPFIIDKTISFGYGSEEIQIIANQKMGIMENDGVVTFPMIYDKICSYANGLAKVQINDKVGIMKNDGTPLLPIIFDNIITESSYNYSIDWEFEGISHTWYANLDGTWIKYNNDGVLETNNIPDEEIRKTFKSLKYFNDGFREVEMAFEGWRTPKAFEMNYRINDPSLIPILKEIIEQKKDSTYYFYSFYDSLVDEFYTDDYRMYLYPELIDLGFKQLATDNSNITYSKVLQNKDCRCLLEKKYEPSTVKNKYKISESINCKERIYEPWELDEEN